MSLKAAIFDFDGTLADTAQMVVHAMQRTFKVMGLPVLDGSVIKPTIGLPLVESLRVMCNTDLATAQKIAEVYRAQFIMGDLSEAELYPGVAETLAVLRSRGVRLAICTSRGFDTLDIILRDNGIKDCFEQFVTISDGLPGKPAPDMTLAILDRMGICADEAVVVGDTTFDIMMGNSAGCRTCGVTYGNHSRERLLTASPTYVVDSFSDILRLM